MLDKIIQTREAGPNKEAVPLLDRIIENAHGKFVHVRFVKKDGTVRTMLCRTGVSKHTKGGKSTLNPEQYLTVWDLHEKGYRAINRTTILSVTIGRVSWLTSPEVDTSEPMVGYVSQD